MAKNEKIIFGIVIVVSLLFGCFRLFQLHSISKVFLLAILTPALLPGLYLLKSRGLLFQLTLVLFILSNVGLFFWQNHFPAGSMLLIIGSCAYLLAGVQLLISINLKKIGNMGMIYVALLGIASVFITIKMLVPFDLGSVDIMQILNLIVFFASSYIVFNVKSNHGQNMRIAKVLFINSILPFTVFVVDLLK